MTIMRCKLFSRGIVLLLVWNTLTCVCINFFTTLDVFLQLSFQVKTKDWLLGLAFGPWLLLPVAGWVGDSLLGRYRAIMAGYFLMMVGFLIFLSAFVMMQFNWTPIPAVIMLCVYILVNTIGAGNIFTNMLPFMIDQMIGASADDISAAVQWYFWTLSLGTLAHYLLVCFSIAQLMNNHAVFTIAIVFLSLSVVLITDTLYHKRLDGHFKRNNPFKTIFQVLNYARKTKYPEHRSALTYFDEEEPSRLDYGKHKFGGPFTEEEVEDVKTILQLMPLYISPFGVYVANNLIVSRDHFQVHIILTTAQNFECVKKLQNIIFYSIAVILIPVYRFIVFPLLHKHIPSLLKRIGTGLVLCLIGLSINLTLDTVGHMNSNNTQCMFDTQHPGSNSTLPIPLYWPLISDFTFGVGVVLASCSAIEFVMAQTPNTMRGFMTGMFCSLLGIGYLVQQGLQLLIGHFNKATPSCGFYYYLVLSILLILSLVLFTIAAKRYKLRERERHVNIQAIAEEHYERYFDQEEEYMREVAKMYESVPQVETISQ